MIRAATVGDLPQLVEYGRAFYDHNRPAWPWDAGAFADTMRRLIEDEDGFVAIGGGFIAALRQPNPISPGWTIAKEFLWWSEGRSGPRLMDAFREWAADAHETHYSCPVDAERVRAFYGRFSQPLEAVYSEVRNVL